MMQHTSVRARLLPGLYLATAFLIPPSWAEEPKPSTPPTTPAAETSALPETIISSTGPQTPESIVIGEVAPRALKIDAPIADLPRSVSVITRQQFEDRGVLTVQDALLYTPGVYGAPYGFDTRGDWSLIRGVSPIDYVDGLRSLFSSYNNTRPHPYSLSSVEVIKGPSSVLFGQSSLGGILHSSSKLPLTRPYNEIFVSYGSFDRLESGIDVGGKEGPLSWRLVTAKRESNTQVDHVSDNTAFISPSFTWEYAEESSLTFLGNFQEARTGTSAQFAPWEGTILPGRNIPSSRFLSEPGFDRYNTDQNAFTGILEHRLNDIFKVEGRARYTTGGADYRSIWPAFPPTISADGIINRTLYISDATSEAFVSDVRLRAEYETGAFRHNTSLGFDYQHADTDNDFHYSYFGGGPFNIYNPLYGQNALDIAPVVDYASTEFEQTGIYLNHRIELGDHWIGSVGARYDELTSVTDDGSPEQFDNAFTFDAGLMYRFKNGIAPYVSYAESFLPVAGTDLNNNPYEPQQGRQYETGIKFQPEDMKPQGGTTPPVASVPVPRVQPIIIRQNVVPAEAFPP
jgi:iron complex outermembrane receptor protein